MAERPVPTGELWDDWLKDLRRWLGREPIFTDADFRKASRAVYVMEHTGPPPPLTEELWRLLERNPVWSEAVELHGWRILHIAEAIAQVRLSAAQEVQSRRIPFAPYDTRTPIRAAIARGIETWEKNTGGVIPNSASDLVTDIAAELEPAAFVTFQCCGPCGQMRTVCCTTCNLCPRCCKCPPRATP